MKRRNPDYEFPPHVRKEALKQAGYCCDRCGAHKNDTKNKYLELHHQLGIAIAIKYYPEISPLVISSLANCRVLCYDCHIIEDKEDHRNHILIAQTLLKVVK